MHGVILAAGYGRRMRPLSEDRHKALLHIGGDTILARIVDGLTEIGAREITLVTGYRDADIREHLAARFPGRAFTYVHNERYAETNNVVSLALALEALPGDADVVLVECDLVLAPGALAALAAVPHGNAALVDDYRTGMDGTVVSVADGHIDQVFPPHVQGHGFVYEDKRKTLNVYRFDRTFCARTLAPLVRWYTDTVDEQAYYELVLGMLPDVPGHRIAAIPVPPRSWIEIDDPNDLAAARFRFEPESRAAILDRTLGGHWNLDVLDFSFMANRHFPPEAMLAAMRHATPQLLAGYGSTQAVLNEKLAWFAGCAAARVQVLHGAAQAFPLLPELLGRPGRVALPAPTFGEYARWFPGAVRYADAPGVDPAALEAHAADCDLVVIVNPNNPTGTTLPTAAIHALAARHPDTRFLVDESFIDFSGEPSLVTALEREPLDNVVVLVSLSKTLGVPGLRLGYLYACDPDVVAALGDRLPVWNLGAPAEHLLELLLKFRPELAASVARTVEDRERLREDLLALDAVRAVTPSGGNFLLTELANVRPGLRGRLLEAESLEVKDVTTRFPDGRPRLRLAVRTAAENAILLRALERHA